MFDSPEAVPSGTRLEVELYVPLDCARRTVRYVSVGAQVRWTSEIPEAFRYKGSNRYRVGAAFDQIDPENQGVIEEYVKERLKMGSVRRLET